MSCWAEDTTLAPVLYQLSKIFATNAPLNSLSVLADLSSNDSFAHN